MQSIEASIKVVRESSRCRVSVRLLTSFEIVGYEMNSEERRKKKKEEEEEKKQNFARNIFHSRTVDAFIALKRTATRRLAEGNQEQPVRRAPTRLSAELRSSGKQAAPLPLSQSGRAYANYLCTSETAHTCTALSASTEEESGCVDAKNGLLNYPLRYQVFELSTKLYCSTHQRASDGCPSVDWFLFLGIVNENFRDRKRV